MSEDEKAKFKPSEPTGDTNEPDSPFFESREAAARAEPTCTYQGHSYKKGARICAGGKVHECGNNGWINLGTNC